MDPKNTNFRVILALTSLPQDVDLSGTSLKVTVSGSTKTIPISNKEATPMDFSGIQVGSKLEFGIEDAEGFMFGYSELKIPNTAFEKNETEITEQLRFYLINKEKESFTATVYVIFLNKGLFKERAKERGALNRPKPVQAQSKSKERVASKSPSGSPTRKSPTRGKSGEIKSTEVKTTEKNFQAYLNRLVDNHSVQIKSLVDEHNSLTEYIQLNKSQNNLPQSFAEKSLETYSPSKLRSSNNLSTLGDESPAGASFTQYKASRSFVEISRNEEKSFRDLSPLVEKEKKAFSGAATDETPAKRQGNITDRSPSSPLRIKGTLERKFSEGSASFASPSKRKLVAAEFTPTGRREIPDATFYNAQITTLNNVVVSQNARISDSELFKKENDDLVIAIQKSENARRTLQDSVLETTNELKHENRGLEKQIVDVIAEKEVLLKKNNELQETIQNLSNNLAATKANLQEKEDINAQNAIKLAELSDLRQQVRTLQESLVASENQKIRDQENYKITLARFQISLEDTTRTIENMNQEKKKLIEDMCNLQQELSLEKVNHQITQNALLLTKKNLENAENYKQSVLSLEIQRDQLTKQLADSRTNHALTQQLLQESVEKLAARQREFELTERNFMRDTNAVNDRLSASEAKNDRLAKELNEQKLKVSQHTTTISALEQVICVKEDIGKQLEAKEKQYSQSVEDRRDLRAQLENVLVSQDQANSRLFEAEKTTNQLRQTIEEMDEQIEHLTVTVIALRESQEVYVPAKGDTIDNAVADYINTGTDVSRLKLLFIRESEGVYQFGTKRVFIKFEGGRILIRVGGGFLGIDEFIEQYGPLETDKLVRTDPLRKLSKNIAINKTLIGKCVNQMEKAKTQAYEVRSDASSVRIMNSCPSPLRSNSKGDY